MAPKSISRLLSLLAALVLASPAALPAEEACGLLWRIQGGAGESHLYGTIHSEDPRVLGLEPPAERAFDAADTYVMEMLPDLGAMAELIRAMHYQDQRNLRDELGEALFGEVADALAEHGVGEGLALKMRPWAAAVTLSFPRAESGMFLDLMLHSRAHRQEKEIAGLESVDEQLAFFRGLDEHEEIALLKASLASRDDRESAMEELIGAYLERRPERLLSLSERQLAELPEALGKRFHREIISERNRVMAERLETHLEEGGAFVAVGALHLYGEDGLVELLGQRGYTVECVY